jgi:hypothetical protein
MTVKCKYGVGANGLYVCPKWGKQARFHMRNHYTEQ